jgi:hypothetical protein
MKHIPVLLQEVLDGLQIKPEGIYVDGTVGMGGHSYAIAKRLTSGRLIGIDRDRTALQESARRLQEFGDRVLLLHGNFTALKTILAEQQITKVDGILLDIGVSSPQIDQAERGFSYLKNGPLDMRMDASQQTSAADIVREADESELEEIFWKYGEERWGRKIAQRIVRERTRQPITTTLELADIVKWLSERIALLSGEDTYRPVIHLDVYGTIGQVFGEREYEKMADYLAALSEAAKPYALRIEGPMDAGGREAQIECMAGLRRCLDERGIPVEIVADEWCNNVDDIRAFADAKAGHMLQIKTPDLGGVQHIAESVLYCKEKGIGAYQGGTCNETDRSTQICIQIAMAVQPDQVLAKPGMGVDEGFMIVYNEMQRILALRKVR